MEHVLVRERERAQRHILSSMQRLSTLIGHRTLRDLSNPFNDPNFQSIYLLTTSIALGLIEELRCFYRDTKYSNSIPVELKFLAALHFYAQGSYQKPDGKDTAVGLSQASVSKAISETTAVLNLPQLLFKWIKFPVESNERELIIQKNFRKFNIPGVLGYLDGTHILIKKPSTHEELYVNRKGQHSLNIQVVCDSDLVILNILSRYPGSTHDAFIWRTSALKDRMAIISEIAPCWLLGDSGYPLEPWLLTPVLNAMPNSPEVHYTNLHVRARNCIERCFGVLKSRFRCIYKNRALEYAPVKTGHIINACAVLHNICIKSGIGEPEIELDDPRDIEAREHVSPDINSDVHRRGIQVRADVINRIF